MMALQRLNIEREVTRIWLKFVLQCSSFEMVEVFSRLSFTYCWCNGMTILLLCCEERCWLPWWSRWNLWSLCFDSWSVFPWSFISLLMIQMVGRIEIWLPLIFRWLRVMMFNLINIMLMAWIMWSWWLQTLVCFCYQGYSWGMEYFQCLERYIVAVKRFLYC